jgi:hypothetical protein
MSRCNAIARINRIGNGLNGHTGDYRCKEAATTAAAYRIINAGTWELTGTEELPTCEKHAAPAMAHRREVKREAAQ